MIIRILTLGFVFQLAMSLMTLNEFNDKIKEHCFEEGLPKLSDTGFTIDNFIYLVEKYERKHLTQNLENNIMMFLKEFNCDGLKYPLSLRDEQEQYALDRFQILEGFLGEKLKKVASLKDDDFTLEEKCHLFFTLTHTVYETERLPKIHREIITNINSTFTTTTTIETPINEQQAKVTVEQGVSSLDGNEFTPVSLGEVLYGLLGALLNEERYLKEFVFRNSNGVDKKFHSAFAFSLSALIAAKEISKESNSIIKDNEWNSAECTRQYILQENAKILTKANLLGSLDGYLIGKTILETEGKSLKLSQILRMYYGKKTFSAKPVVESFCKRSSVFEDINFKVNLEKQVNTYISWDDIKKNKYKEASVNDSTAKAVNDYYFNIGPEVTNVKATEGRCKPENISCETPSNIVFVLDKRAHFDEQLTSTAKLINKLNIGPDESNVIVLVNSKDENLNIDMEKIVDITDNKAKAACLLTEYNKNDHSELEESAVLLAINRMLTGIEQNSLSIPGVPSKVVVYYNYGSSRNENKQVKVEIENARRELINKHRGARIIGVGEDMEHLKKFIKDYSLNFIDPRGKNLVEELKQRICWTPAEFQYQECKTRSTFNQEHLLYLSADGIQYWHMQPKYFYKSFGYKLKFKPENGNIRVCFDRKLNIKESDCQQTNEGKTEIEFSKRDPCKGFTDVTCDPFYFKISGLDDAHLTNCQDSADSDSNKPVCKTSKQIKVSFNHEGLACNNAIRQIGSFYHFLLAVFAVVYIASRKS